MYITTSDYAEWWRPKFQEAIVTNQHAQLELTNTIAIIGGAIVVRVDQYRTKHCCELSERKNVD